VLACAEGLDNQTVARKLRAGLIRMTISRIWHAFGLTAS